MMSGEKEEEKAMAPMFPRLHVNDTDKGGPRAPPRNKMALYEQLSIPSHRFGSAVSSALSRPISASAVVPSGSSSQGCSQERGVFSPFHGHAQPTSHPNEKVHSHVSDEKTVNSTKTELERSIRHVNRRSSNATISVAECSLLQPHDVSDAKSSSSKRFDEEDDFRVPTFVHSEVASSANEHTVMKENERLSSFHVNSLSKGCSPAFSSSLRSPNSYDKSLGQKGAFDMKSKKRGSRDSEQVSRETVIIKENTEKSALHEDNGQKFAELSAFRKEYLNHEDMRTGNVIEETCQGTIGVYRNSFGNGALDELGCLSEQDVVKEGIGLRWRSESCLKTSCGNSNGNSNTANNCSQENDNKASGSQELGDRETNDEVSEILMDSISSLNISPDDVVGVIGQKQFWKARRAIVNQQRIFALQVFELHRLIKVQKLIAASPHLLLGDEPYINTSEVPCKNAPPGSNVESQPKIAKQKDDLQKQNQEAERSAENTGVQPLSSCGDDPNKILGQPSGNEPCPGELPAVPVAPDRPGTWCFRPPANQWLVPVMSPTEGLVYKPCSGPCPPSTDFMPTIYGGCGPMRLPQVGDFMNTVYGVPAYHQQQLMGVLPGAPTIASNYFMSPYGLVANNPAISGSAVDQESQMTGARPGGPHEQHSWISSMSTPKSEASLGCPRKFNAAKEGELEGTTESNASEGTQEGRDPPNIFPLALPAEGPSRLSQPNDGDRQTHVIRVVPHNASSASESAARIFQSIQEERRQNDL